MIEQHPLPIIWKYTRKITLFSCFIFLFYFFLSCNLRFPLSTLPDAAASMPRKNVFMRFLPAFPGFFWRALYTGSPRYDFRSLPGMSHHFRRWWRTFWLSSRPYTEDSASSACAGRRAAESQPPGTRFPALYVSLSHRHAPVHPAPMLHILWYAGQRLLSASVPADLQTLLFQYLR